MSVWEDVARELEELGAAGLRRVLRTAEGPCDPEMVLDGWKVLNFGSNNYLSLASHPEVLAAAATAARRHGAGAGASRLITGNHVVVERLEAELAAFKGTEAALVFSSGYLANLGAIPALVGEDDLVLSDRLNHASLIDACRLSRATLKVYAHADADAARDALVRNAGRHRRKLIVTDGLFSMDGDVAPLPALVALAEAHEAWLLVDDAHGTGVLGMNGTGALEATGAPRSERVIQMGTLSKALGSQGGFIAGPRVLRDSLVNRARAFVFDTGIAPSCAGAALAALALVRREPDRRERLRAASARVQDKLRVLGLNIPAGEGPVIPVLLGDNARAMRWMDRLLAAGLFVPGIRPPTVPAGEARLRISLQSGHTDAHLDALISAFDLLLRNGV